MTAIFFRGAAGWAAVQVLSLGPIIFLILLVAVKGDRRGMLISAAAIGGAGLASGLLLGGPLAAAIVGWGELRGVSGGACGFLAGAGLGLVELIAFIYPSKGKASFRKLVPVFSSVGAMSGLVATLAAA